MDSRSFISSSEPAAGTHSPAPAAVATAHDRDHYPVPSAIADAAAARPAGGVPWAFVGALLILLVVEGVFRGEDPKAIIDYDLGEQEYHAVAAYVETLAPPDVCFIGSSHTREGILAGEVSRRCERAGLGELTVANFGVSAARADAAEALVQRLLAQSRKPRMILFGLSVRDVRSPERDWARLATFWGVREWGHALKANRRDVGPLFPQVLRNQVGRRYRTLWYRDSLRSRLSRWFRGYPPTPSAVFGESLTEAHQENRSLKRRGVAEHRVAQYLAYNRLDTPGWSDQDRVMIDALLRLASRCRDAGVDLVLYEMPMSDVLRARLARGLYEEFLTVTRDVSARTDVPFVTTTDLSIEVGEGGFSEYSHLNYKGAMKLTKALTDQVVIPRLKALDAQR